MNLSKLFETQDVLDERIVKEKGLEGQDLLPMKILALQAELGELANEWRGFKYWSENNKPRTRVDSTTSDRRDFDYFQCFRCDETLALADGKEYLGTLYADCPQCDIEMHAMKARNPLLEEYVDCLHFILTIGLSLGMHSEDLTIDSDFASGNPVVTFMAMFDNVSVLTSFVHHSTLADLVFAYEAMLNLFIGLGEMLGFTWEQVEAAYYAKNQINHERQATGY